MHLEQVEDAVQSALTSALTAWVAGGLPRDPGAWLYRASWNELIGALRGDARRERILDGSAAELSPPGALPPDSRLAGEVADDLLRMLFVSCDDAIPRESRLVFSLKTLCGFSTAEIALRLFTTEANAHKRLQRARERLRELPLEAAPLEQLRSRLGSVHEVLYLLFNEGYLSAHPEEALRLELCDEAVRLTTLLAEHPVGAVPETFALLALMHLHAARFPARIGGGGELLLLDEQDRRSWDAERIAAGVEWLARSATGEAFSRYHAEAGIAAEHCLAPSFAETRWEEIAALYELLERAAPSPLHTLNRAVAIAEWKDAEAALALLEQVEPGAELERSYLWQAVHADLHRRAGHAEAFGRHRAGALAAAPTAAVRALIERRFTARSG